jgi:hypothetical protein
VKAGGKQSQYVSGDRIQLASGAGDALTEKTEASTSVNPPGIIGSCVVLELQETWTGALFPATEKDP